MLSERLFEDILVKYPELIEDKLTFLGRQVTHYGKRIDILCEDRFNEKLIVELKIGNLHRDALSQVLEYEGYILSEKDPSARVLIIANRIPLNLKKAMDHHGIEYKEITQKQLLEFLEKRDKSLLQAVVEEAPANPIVTEKSGESKIPSKARGGVTMANNDHTTPKQVYAEPTNLLHEYWTGLKNYMEANQSPVTLRRPKARNWDDISIGTSDIYISFAVNSKDNTLNIWLTLRGPEAKNRLRQLHRIAYNKSLIQVNSDLVYDFMEGRKRCAVTLKRKADYRIRKEWIDQFKWFKENLERFDWFFRPLISQI